MTTANTQTAAVTAPSQVNQTPTADVVTIKEHPVTYKDIAFRLTRHETQGKGDKAAPVAYWGISPTQFDLPPVKDASGKDVPVSDDDQASHHVDMLASLVGWPTIRDMAYAKVNTNLKASQCEQGKDVYTMDDKAKYAIDYIQADWGVNSKGGGAAIKALKETNTRQGEVLAKLASAFTRMQKATPADAAAIMAEIAILTAEASKLAGK